jgi:oligoribonuclease
MADQIIDDQIVYAVVDIETTGLNAIREVPLEFGIALTDANGFIIQSESWLIHDESALYHQCIARAKAHHIVGPMHEKSGLWADLDGWEKGQIGIQAYTREAADTAITQWLTDMGAPTELGMMGNSTGSLDRPFVLQHFPLVDLYLGYRNIDMSSLKELVKRTNPELWAQIKPLVGDKSLADHRTIGDIKACIEEYRVYLREFLITGDVIDS